MLLDNKAIIGLLKDTAKLLELHGANPFQVRHYNNAALNLEQGPPAVAGLSLEALNSLEGLKPSTVKLVHEINTTGTLQRWEELQASTPHDVIEMMHLRGLGPHRARAIWKDLGIKRLAALQKACEQGQVAQLPGFGPKIQDTILESLAFKARQVGKFHYASALPYATQLEEQLRQAFPHLLCSIAGDLRRKLEVVEQVTVLVGTDLKQPVLQWLDQWPGIQKEEKMSGPLAWRGTFVELPLKVAVLFCAPQDFYKQLILQTGSAAHLQLPVHEGLSLGEVLATLEEVPSEEAFYQQVNLPPIPPELREGQVELAWAREQGAPSLLAMEDLRGVLHSHTTYSDGKHSLEEMARHCQALGYEYLGISDHSQVAVYAGGLTVENIQRQHEEIDRLNEALAPFKILKGIEADVLGDGQLDYTDEVLARFDFVIASVHTGMKMNVQKATDRVLKAICNPYTTILAHLTNRLLLKREGFPVDHRAVIDACAVHGVIIEINGNPWRLELDWRWVDYALSKNVWISVNPDAHDQAGVSNMYYGVCVGRKGGLTAAQTFNALSRDEVVAYFERRKTQVV